MRIYRALVVMLAVLLAAACHDSSTSPERLTPADASYGSTEPNSVVVWGDEERVGEYGLLSDAPTGGGYVAVSAGKYHALALHEDGSIYAWGRDEYGEVSNTPTDADFVAVSAGEDHSLALRSDGTVVTWGSNEYGQSEPLTDGWVFSSVDAGAFTNIGVFEETETMRSYLWGLFGLSSYYCYDGLDLYASFVEVSAAYGHFVGLLEDGSVQSSACDDIYGLRSEGPPAGSDFVAVSAGSVHGLALRDDGTIVGWGGDKEYSELVDVPPDDDFIAISAGNLSHSLALHEDGTLTSWGGAYLTGPWITDTPTDDGFVAVSAGWTYSLAIQGEPPEATEIIEAAIGSVETLQTDGILNEGTANSLIKKLNIALALVNKGKNKPACKLVAAFVKEVEALMENGTLSPEDADTLRSLAESATSEACGS